MSETAQEYPEDEWYLHEELVSFGKLARLIPGSINSSTIGRWSKRGCLSKKHRLTKLQSRLIGGQNKTSLQRFRVFTERLNDDDKEDPAPEVAVRLPVNPQKSPERPRIDGEK